MINLLSFLLSILCTCLFNGAIVECISRNLSEIEQSCPNPFLQLLKFSTKKSNIYDLLNEELSNYGKINLTDGNYEIAQFWHKTIEFGDERGKVFRFKRSGKNVTWSMKESSIIRYKTPVWLVYSEYSITGADTNIIGDTVAIYEDPALYITILHSMDYLGHASLYGSLGIQNVAPISNRLARSLRKEKPHLFEEAQEPGTLDELEGYTLSKYHVIYTPELPENRSIILPSRGSPELFKKFEKKYEQTPYERVKRSKADVIYPEILLFLDYGQEHSTTKGSRLISLLMYIINFWNSVDLRFRSLKDPEVRLRIAGIYVGMSNNALSFMKRNMHSGKVNARSALFDALEWVKSGVSLSWDFIITQTTSDLYILNDQRNLGGLAFMKGSCDGFGKLKMAGIVNDDMTYSGIRAAAHEIGHILGATHDTSESPDDCKDTDGYMMSSDGIYNQHSFEWSQCSKQQIIQHLRHSKSDCYNNDEPETNEGELIHDLLLPGDKLDQKMQCNIRGYACICATRNACEELRCRHAFWFCTNTGPALDGTPCPGGECRNGKCAVADYQSTE